MRARYWIPAALCAVLGVIVYFCAFGYQFTAFLLVLAAAVVLVFGFVDALRKRFPRGMKWLRRVLLAGLCIVLGAMLVTSVWIGVNAGGAQEPEADYLIVLGAERAKRYRGASLSIAVSSGRAMVRRRCRLRLRF